VRPGFFSFLQTSYAVLVHPTRFYRNLATRAAPDRSGSFAVLHWIMTSILFGAAAAMHALWYTRFIGSWQAPSLVLLLTLINVTFVTLWMTTRIAALLTAWEAAYRGLRMPIDAVTRALHFHAPHYLPVSLMAAATVLGYQWLLVRRIVPITSATTYLYVLCGEVIVGAWYLFRTYWIGMRNIMYANA
jgi:hypothetical protein